MAGSATKGRPNSWRPALAASSRVFRPGGDREEAVEDDLEDFVAGQLGLEAPADDLRPSAGDRHRPTGGGEVGEELFLGDPARVAEGAPLLGVEPGRAQLLLDLVGQGQVDVVAAEHQVVADGDPAKPGAAGGLDDGDEAEVGGPAADVADEDQFPGADLALPDVLVGDDPAVERRLGLLEQDRAGDPGALRGLDGQFSSGLVERGGDGEDDFLVLEPVRLIVFGEAVVPGVADVGDVVGRGLDGRDLAGFGRRAPGENGGLSVDAGMAEPALGRGHEMAGNPRPLDPGELADDPVGLPSPGEVRGPLGQLVPPREVEKRGEHASRGRLAGRDQLRHLERADVGRRTFATLRVDIGHGAVGGPEVDADDVSRACHERPDGDRDRRGRRWASRIIDDGRPWPHLEDPES